ncbi:MAG TPA: hypothetical protein VLG68_01050 [Gammaproteobacteria bacterium]|nr:hypothetical protein [Gammaproteobacteria bacterium]
MKTCGRELHGVYDFGAVGNAIVTSLYTVFTLGTDVGEYEFCKYIDTLHPAPASSVTNGRYLSEDKSFELAIPEQLKQDSQNPSGIWQAENYPDMAMFPSAETEGRVFFAGVYPKLTDRDVSLSPRSFEPTIFHGNGAQYLDARGVNLQRLYEEDITIKGEPAVFVVYQEDSQTTTATKPAVAATSSAPIFLLYWVIKTSAHAARLTVVWPGDCPKCSTGPETEIRKMSPSITTFIDSFRFTGIH